MSLFSRIADVLDPSRKWARIADSIPQKGPSADKVMNLGGFEGSTHSRRTDGWNYPKSGSADEVAQWGIQTLRERSRDLVRNHWLAKRVIMVLVSGIVGKGIRPSCKGNKDFDDLLKSLYKPQSQVGGQKGQSLLSVQRLVARTVIESGSCLVIRDYRTFDQMRERNLALPMQFRVLEPDFLDCRYDGIRDGKLVYQGIRYDRTGWPEAYRIYRNHPGTIYPHKDNLTSDWIDSTDVSHVFWQERAGQTIGIPWLAPVILKTRGMDEFEDAQLVRQKVAALFSAFVRSDVEYEDDNDLVSLEPGRIQYLGAGEDIVFPDPPTVGDYDEFTTSQTRGIAASVGLSYERASNDYSRVNFTSARMSALVERDLEKQWQDEMMIGMLCQDLDRWIEEGATLMGISTEGECKWTPPARELIDPSREVGAMERKIAAGLSSRQHEVEQLGRDVEDVDEERQRDEEREDSLGLNSDDPQPQNRTERAADRIEEVADRFEIV